MEEGSALSACAPTGDLGDEHAEGDGVHDDHNGIEQVDEVNDLSDVDGVPHGQSDHNCARKVHKEEALREDLGLDGLGSAVEGEVEHEEGDGAEVHDEAEAGEGGEDGHEEEEGYHSEDSGAVDIDQALFCLGVGLQALYHY